MKILLIYFFYLEVKNEVNFELDLDFEEFKKSRYRYRFLRYKLIVSDGEFGEEKKVKFKEYKEVKGRNRRKGKIF